MATDISLHNYLKKINQLLEENRYPEAVQHAQHILKHFSRHVPTYLLLGQALLEQQDFSGAIDLLQRVLSTNPNEFVAHLGLSIAYSEEGLYPQAMWHLLRANEMDPYNTNIQRELKELYRQQHGEYLSEIPISQASLARLHFKGGQYSQAIASLRQSLAILEEDRVDLELLLAEALWRNKQRIEAVEICDSILKKLPNCIVANAIVAEIYLQGERQNKANEHLQLVQTLTQMDQVQLDVSTTVGAAFSSPAAMPLPQEIRLPQLDDKTLNGGLGIASDVDTPTIADWVADFGLDEALEQDNDLYDWLHPIAESGEETAVVDSEPSWLEQNLENELEPIQLASDQLEAWETSLTDETLFANIDPEPVNENEDDIPNWLQNTPQTSPSTPEAKPDSEGSIPDWLQINPVDDNKNLTAPLTEQFDVTEDSVTEDKGKKSKNVADDAKADSVDDALSWLDDLIDQDSLKATPTQPTQPSESQEEALPDWLKDLSVDTNQPEAIPNEDLPDWLREATLTTETALPGVLDSAGNDEKAAPPESDEDSLNEIVEAEISKIDTDLSWLDELTTESAQPDDDLVTMTWQEDSAVVESASTVTSDAEEEPQDFDEAMAWLEDLAAEQSSPIEEPPTVAQGLFGTEILRPETAVSEPAESDDLDEAMAWLDELASESPEASSLANANREATNLALETDVDESADNALDTMAWLDELAADESALAQEESAVSVDDNLADALDWLEAQTADSTPATEAVDFELDTPAASIKPPLEMPEDPDEALAWLEQLAADTYQLDGDEAAAVTDEVDEITTELLEPIAETEEADATADDLLAVPEDPDEAMAWLEQLAANQGAPLDELPSLQEQAAHEVDETAVAEESAASPGTEAALTEPPDDLDDAMAWLDQLAADQGAPLDELPTVQSTAEIAAEDSVDETEMDVAESAADDIDVHAVPDDPDEAMAWLEQLAARQGAPLDELPSLQETVDEAATVETVEPTENEVAVEDELGDPMAWLEELMDDEEIIAEEVGTIENAAGFLAPMDILEPDSPIEDVSSEEEAVVPTAIEASDSDEPVSEPPDDLDDAMAWLEQLAANQGAPLDELPSLQEADVDVVETTVVDAPDLAAEATIPETEIFEADEPIETDAAVSEPPDALDNAMAWLEQLAADQGAPLDELPSLQEADEDVIETAVVDKPELAIEELTPEAEISEAAALEAEGASSEPPDDLDDAMAWLEQLAANQGAPLDELPSLQEADDVVAETAVVDAPDLAAELTTPEAEVPEVEPIEADATVSEPPDDLDDAMAWLEQLAANQGAPLDELPSLQEADEAAEAENVVEAEEADGITDDPMAWLNELAAEQGVALESEEVVEPEVETAVVEAASDVPVDVVPTAEDEDAADAVDDAFAWLDELATDENLFAETDEVVESASIDATEDTEETDVATAEADESLPDWLAHEPPPATVGDTGWLQAIAEPDMADWLTSEEEATTGSLEQDGFGTDALDTITEPEPLPEPIIEDPEVIEPAINEPTSVLDVDEDQLSTARGAIEKGDLQTAVVSYQSLLDNGDGLSVLIAELENATVEVPKQPKLHQLLGDAYLRNGQLQKALNTYRDALNAL